MEERETMGRRIAALRRQAGLTQEQVAERLGVTAQAVSKWENDVSCPDISLLPGLAELLGVSTDELLGVRPVEPRVVVVDTDKSRRAEDGEKQRDSAGWNRTWDIGLRGGVFWGLLIALIGAAVLLDRFGLWPLAGKPTLWGIVWPAALLGLGVAWTCRRFSLFSLALALLGLYYLLFNLGAVAYVLTWDILWPAALVLIGLSILLDQFFPRLMARRGIGASFSGDEGGGEREPVDEYSDEDGFVRLSCAFSDVKREAMSGRDFLGGEVDVSFGAATLDLTGCRRVTPGAKLRLDVSFGSATIVLPRSVRLAPDVDRAFGSSAVKGTPDADAPDVLAVRGDVSFGSVTFRYAP